jgi:hypothetical protein
VDIRNSLMEEAVAPYSVHAEPSHDLKRAARGEFRFMHINILHLNNIFAGLGTQKPITVSQRDPVDVATDVKALVFSIRFPQFPEREMDFTYPLIDLWDTTSASPLTKIHTVSDVRPDIDTMKWAGFDSELDSARMRASAPILRAATRTRQARSALPVTAFDFTRIQISFPHPIPFPFV